MEIQIGIDLGTTNTVIGYFSNGKVEFLRHRNKESISSSILYQNGIVTVGENARKRSVLFPENYIKSSKAHIGDNTKSWTIEDRNFSPTDVAIEVLKEVYGLIVKKFPDATKFEAVITVPAYFDSNQIDETRKAGEMAGFVVTRIITEPVAAAIAYGIEDQINQKIAVIDVGGGTFDVSVLEIKDGEYEVLSAEGDRKLGGDDFDEHILNYMLSYIRITEGVNLANLKASNLAENEYRKAYQILLNKAEDVKIELSDAITKEIDIANLYPGFNLMMSMTRNDFLDESKGTLKKIEKVIGDIIKIHPINTINKVVLVGGSARIPAIAEFVSKIFGQTPFADRALDKLVAQGAAILAHKNNSIQIKDIITHSLGIEVDGDLFSPILKKNSHYPISKTEKYSTVVNYQKEININIFEGEDELNVNNNQFYGGFTLTHIQDALAGVPKIEVTFEFDQSRVLKVTARDMQTESTQTQEIAINKLVKKRIKPQFEAFDIALLIDTSSSMNGERINKAKEACLFLVDELIDLSCHRVGIIKFASFATVATIMSQNSSSITKAIKNISSGGATDIADALRLANDDLLTFADPNKKIVILVTDGESPEAPAIIQSDRLKKRGIRIVTIGVGSDIDSRILKTLATKNDYYHIDTIDNLKDIFVKVSNSLKAIQL